MSHTQADTTSASPAHNAAFRYAHFQYPRTYLPLLPSTTDEAFCPLINQLVQMIHTSPRTAPQVIEQIEQLLCWPKDEKERNDYRDHVRLTLSLSATFISSPDAAAAVGLLKPVTGTRFNVEHGGPCYIMYLITRTPVDPFLNPEPVLHENEAQGQRVM